MLNSDTLYTKSITLKRRIHIPRSLETFTLYMNLSYKNRFWVFSGCFYTSSGGLRSYEHPVNELKAVPRIDSSGEVCGLTFKVDADTKKKGHLGMPRVGSDANWSQHY